MPDASEQQQRAGAASLSRVLTNACAPSSGLPLFLVAILAARRRRFG